MRYCLSGNKLSIFGKSEISIAAYQETLTSEEGSGWAADAGIEGWGGVSCIQDRLGLSVLGFERNRLEIDPEPIRRPMLDGEVGSKEEEGYEAGGGEQCSLPFSEGFRMGCVEGERNGAQMVLITKERVLRGAGSKTHGGGRLWGCRWKKE